MTIEEAIEALEFLRILDAPELSEAVHMAINALRAQQEAENNEPLTLDELQKMDGQPVWLDDSPNGWRCFIVNLEFPVSDRRVWSAPCGVDALGRVTSLPLLAECGLYRRSPVKEEFK